MNKELAEWQLIIYKLSDNKSIKFDYNIDEAFIIWISLLFKLTIPKFFFDLIIR